jgi:hypothetical protein
MLEFTVSHNGTEWVAENDDMRVSAPTLGELDLELAGMLAAKHLLREKETIRILMCFDNSTIPQWIRQYSQHYFNRVVELKGSSL